MDQVVKDILFIAGGIGTTFQLLLGAIILGLILGTGFAICRYNNICKGIINFIISFLRGTPLLLQLGIVFYVLPRITGMKINITTAGIITMGINSSAYIAEIIRSGINTIPKGQFEAAYALNIPIYYTWKDIILPQVVKNVAGSMTNEVISLLKETALISVIGGVDIMRKAQIIAAERFEYFGPLIIAALFYYVIVLMLQYLGLKIEKILKND